jgi:hypothetical protein
MCGRFTGGFGKIECFLVVFWWLFRGVFVVILWFLETRLSAAKNVPPFRNIFLDSK